MVVGERQLQLFSWMLFLLLGVNRLQQTVLCSWPSLSRTSRSGRCELTVCRAKKTKWKQMVGINALLAETLLAVEENGSCNSSGRPVIPTLLIWGVIWALVVAGSERVFPPCTLQSV